MSAAIWIMSWCIAVGGAVLIMSVAIRVGYDKTTDELKAQLRASYDREKATLARLDIWRTKARVLQGKYEPIGTVINVEVTQQDVVEHVDKWWLDGREGKHE